MTTNEDSYSALIYFTEEAMAKEEQGSKKFRVLEMLLKHYKRMQAVEREAQEQEVRDREAMERGEYQYVCVHSVDPGFDRRDWYYSKIYKVNLGPRGIEKAINNFKYHNKGPANYSTIYRIDARPREFLKEFESRYSGRNFDEGVDNLVFEDELLKEQFLDRIPQEQYTKIVEAVKKDDCQLICVSGIEEDCDGNEKLCEAYYTIDPKFNTTGTEEAIAKFKEAYPQCKKICRIEIRTGVEAFSRPDRFIYL